MSKVIDFIFFLFFMKMYLNLNIFLNISKWPCLWKFLFDSFVSTMNVMIADVIIFAFLFQP